MPGLPGVPPAEELSALARAGLAAWLAGADQVIGELTARAEQLPARVEQLTGQNERLAARVEQLGRQAGRDSSASLAAGLAASRRRPDSHAVSFPSRIRQWMPGLARPGMFQLGGRDLTERLQSA